MHRGYLPLWRKFFDDHPFWQEKRKFSRSEAWIDILINTHFKDDPKQRLIRGRLVSIEYGQCLMTTRYCGQRWKWPKTAVIRFLNLLESMEQIELKCVHQMTIISVCNFEKYDPKRTSDVSSGGPVADQWRTSDVSKLKNVKNDKNVKNIYSPNFEIFWKSYPNKSGKSAALKSWQKRKDLPELEIILQAIKKQIEWRKNSAGKFRPEWKNPATWINQGCWEDECDPHYGATNGGRLQQNNNGTEDIEQEILREWNSKNSEKLSGE